jgi:hypothetical protein
MKTDDLIAMLATGVAPIDPHLAAKRFATALLAGGAGAFALMLMGYGLRPDLAQAALSAMLWVKLGFALALALSALVLTERLSRPGVRPGQAWIGVALPWLAISVMGLVVLMNAPPEARLGLVLGRTWLSCAFSISLLSLPVFAGVVWALRGLAPTRPALAGACAGLLSAAVGTLVYALHCPEVEAPFLAVWYVLGLLIPTAAGAMLGPKLLRW